MHLIYKYYKKVFHCIYTPLTKIVDFISSLGCHSVCQVCVDQVCVL